ncbi:hypothetical protein HGO34_08155 [Agrobacterium vitis]|uniref:Sulfotransferase family protein n=1 Tax=Agrobacterium vitis TaxID=373 RepID=A0AAE4WBA4_AGRVI|nr:hypothetical protein [Agrobacterium vitis]MCF1496612.1 hypothetical protein [Allorhizobium sp. Av2]MCM2439687.1 hypothetical protein [Agrobacterium vitis]MUZ57416.1 hypothetical protein [Agrobacterium vitis]MVA69076.1 hypothetical protein [Agrobacterium vitis]MVA86750.1 hypothetical protein [Agrobacterium vitis]
MSNAEGYRVGSWAVQGCVDTTQESLVWPIVEFHGWVAFRGSRKEFDIYLNGVKLEIQSFGSRQDVEEAMGAGWDAIGWSAVCDVGPTARDNGHALELEIRVIRQTIARKYFRYRDRFEAGTSPLKIVLHMPKTGGTSLRMALEEYRHDLFILPIYNGDFTRINGLSTSSVDKVDVAYGHTSYGVHHHIARPATYMTVLRNPYDFVSSLYFYSKYVQQDADMIEKSNIIEALKSLKRPEFDNYYTRSISGLDAALPVTEEHLEEAIYHIDSHFSFIGLAERPRESLKTFSRIFGLPLSYMSENITPLLVEREYIDPIEVNDAIRKHVGLDLKLYQYVLRKFWNMEIA